MSEPRPSDRPHKRACHRCGGDMTDGQVRRQEFDEKQDLRNMDELDSIYSHLRAVIENCKTMDTKAIRHQLVGLLPEVQTFQGEQRQKMLDSNLADLVARQDENARQAWADYGYPDEGKA